MTESGDVRFLSIKEVAVLLGICSRSVYRLIAAGELPQPVKVGNASRWTDAEIRAFQQRLLKGRGR
jgi:excisionase family DNA binding protein